MMLREQFHGVILWRNLITDHLVTTPSIAQTTILQLEGKTCYCNGLEFII